MLCEKNTTDLVKTMLFPVVSKSQFSQLSPRLCETNNWILFKDLFVPVWLRIIKSGSFLKTFLTSVFWMCLSSEESDKFPSGE